MLAAMLKSDQLSIAMLYAQIKELSDKTEVELSSWG